MKCERCGQVYDEPVSICTVCGYDFDEAPRLKKLLMIKPEPVTEVSSDLVDYPVLTFICGLLSLILPILVFSFITLKLAKKPGKVSLDPLRNLGRIFAYLGFIVSSGVIVLLLFTFAG